MKKKRKFNSTQWITDAVDEPGAFTKQAKRAGKSVGEYAQAKKDAPGKMGKRARLALTFRKMAKKRKDKGA